MLISEQTVGVPAYKIVNTKAKNQINVEKAFNIVTLL